jgi:hypothetical protein
MNLTEPTPVYSLTLHDARALWRVRCLCQRQGLTLQVMRSAPFIGRFVAQVIDGRGTLVGTFESADFGALMLQLNAQYGEQK